MIEAVHVVVGAAIAEKTGSPALGMFFAFLSHYVLDVIPHIDEYDLKKDPSKLGISLSVALKVTVDILFGIMIVVVFSKNLPLALAGGFFAVLPDVPNLPFSYFPQNRLLKLYHNFHSSKLQFYKRMKIPIWVRTSTQVLACLAAIYFLR